jgi:hypothetical protein
MGQTLRVAVSLHVLFEMKSEKPASLTISRKALLAAIDFVEVCIQHTAYIAGRGKIDDDISLVSSGISSLLLLLNITHKHQVLINWLKPERHQRSLHHLQ